MLLFLFSILCTVTPDSPPVDVHCDGEYILAVGGVGGGGRVVGRWSEKGVCILFIDIMLLVTSHSALAS